MAEERERHRLDPHAARDRDDRCQDLPGELHVGGQVEQVVRHADRDDHGRADQDPAGLLIVREEGEPRGEDADQDRETAEPRRRELMQPAGAGLVDRADSPGERLHDRRRDPDDHERKGEREKGVCQIRHGGSPLGSGRSDVFRPDTVALEPERECEQAPELAAQVLAPATCASISAVTASGPKKPWRADASGDRTSRANGSRSPRSQAAAGIEKPCLRPRTISCGRSGATALRSRRFLAKPADLASAGQRERQLGDDRVAERHPRLERVRHARAVGLHEQVVGEVDAQVDVLEPRELVGALGLGVAGAVDVDGRVDALPRPCPSSRSARARVRREDLLPRVMALERRADARRARSASPCSRSWPCREELGRRSTSGRGGRGEPPDPRRKQCRRRRCSSRRTARRRPRPRARP